jgi:hypothetical protein
VLLAIILEVLLTDPVLDVMINERFLSFLQVDLPFLRFIHVLRDLLGFAQDV